MHLGAASLALLPPEDSSTLGVGDLLLPGAALLCPWGVFCRSPTCGRELLPICPLAGAAPTAALSVWPAETLVTSCHQDQGTSLTPCAAGPAQLWTRRGVAGQGTKGMAWHSRAVGSSRQPGAGLEAQPSAHPCGLWAPSPRPWMGHTPCRVGSGMLIPQSLQRC